MDLASLPSDPDHLGNKLRVAFTAIATIATAKPECTCRKARDRSEAFASKASRTWSNRCSISGNKKPCYGMRN